MTKEYKVPEELAIFMDKMIANEQLKDKCIKSPFGFRRARRCAINAQYFSRKFWVGLREMYPELNYKSVKYNPGMQIALLYDEGETT